MIYGPLAYYEAEAIGVSYDRLFKWLRWPDKCL